MRLAPRRSRTPGSSDPERAEQLARDGARVRLRGEAGERPAVVRDGEQDRVRQGPPPPPAVPLPPAVPPPPAPPVPLGVLVLGSRRCRSRPSPSARRHRSRKGTRPPSSFSCGEVQHSVGSSFLPLTMQTANCVAAVGDFADPVLGHVGRARRVDVALRRAAREPRAPRARRPTTIARIAWRVRRPTPGRDLPVPKPSTASCPPDFATKSIGMFTVEQPLPGEGNWRPRKRPRTHWATSFECTLSTASPALQTEPPGPTWTLTVMLPEASLVRRARW